MIDKLISVIMPAYNDRIDYVEKAIQSILQQTYAEWELIVIDSSTNNRIKDLISIINDKRIDYYYQKKNGIASALNFGISKANGEYIARMDADDISDIDRFRKQISYLESNLDVFVLGTSYDIINEFGIVIGRENVAEDYRCIIAKLLFDNCICHPTVMIRKELFEEGYGYRDVVAEDYDLWTRAIRNFKFVNLPDALLKYRVHADNTSSSLEISVAESDSISTKAYIENLIDMSLIDYEQIHFIKSYYALFLEKEIKEYKDRFIIIQLELLRNIYRSNINKKFCDMKSLEYEINKRLKLIFNLLSIMNPQLLSIVCYDIWNVMNMDLDEIEKLLIDNNNRVLKEISVRKSFYLYGMGERARETLNQINRIRKQLRWDLVGIIDKESKEYIFNGEKCETVSLSSIEEADYIIISAKRKYTEIWNNLIEFGISPEKIISDSLFYYL